MKREGAHELDETEREEERKSVRDGVRGREPAMWCITQTLCPVC